jgi:hypothetical protein
MPLKKQDVLDTLNDPVILQIDFWVGVLHVNSMGYGHVRDLIVDDAIQVAEGTESIAKYSSGDHKLITQNVNPPADLEARGLLLHECTHALIEVLKLGLTGPTEEVSCYLAQHTYILLSNPNWTVSPNNAPWFHFFQDVVKVVKKYKLNEKTGRGARVQWADLSVLRPELNHLNIYTGLSDTDVIPKDGVPLNKPVDRQQAYEDPVRPSEDYIVSLLSQRFAKDDVAGYGARVQKLVVAFQDMDQTQAKNLLPRLQVRKNGDRVSMPFYDILSMATRGQLLGILSAKF